MWPYWLMFLVPTGMALNEFHRSDLAFTPHEPLPAPRIPLVWWLVMLALTLLVGWRHEVGGDWMNYAENYRDAAYASQYADWWWNDPGYRLLEWTALQAGWTVYAVNLMAGGVFSYGLILFCRSLPRPWLALAVAMPYLVIIVGMGYSRQGLALGCLMAGLVGLGRGRVLHFVIWTVLAATFHKTAVLLLPTAALAASQRRVFTALWVGVVVAAAYALLLADSLERLQVNYLGSQYASEGALVRLAMNALPAMLLLVNRARFVGAVSQQRLWIVFAMASLALVGAYYASPSSTAVDRVALYLLPLQLMVFAYLPEVLGSRDGTRSIWVLGVLAYYATVQYVWLNYATHAFAWIPYRFYPLDSGF